MPAAKQNRHRKGDDLKSFQAPPTYFLLLSHRANNGLHPRSRLGLLIQLLVLLSMWRRDSWLVDLSSLTLSSHMSRSSSSRHTVQGRLCWGGGTVQLKWKPMPPKVSISQVRTDCPCECQPTNGRKVEKPLRITCSPQQTYKQQNNPGENRKFRKQKRMSK